MPRFVVEERELDEDGDEYYDGPVDVLVDTNTGKVVYADGGEPEDMSLCRNLSTFVSLLNGVDSEKEDAVYEAIDDVRAGYR